LDAKKTSKRKMIFTKTFGISNLSCIIKLDKNVCKSNISFVASFQSDLKPRCFGKYLNSGGKYPMFL
jgi:hypothetical protein